MYKVPDIDQSKIDDLANVFLVGTDIDQLSPSEQAQARNVTRSIFVVQQGDESVTVQFVDNDNILPEEGDGGAINAVSSKASTSSFLIPILHDHHTDVCTFDD